MTKLIEPLISNTRKQISKYFKHYEVVRSGTAARKEIDNDVYCPKLAYNAEQLGINVLDPIREEFGPYGPSSWYRSEDLEREITTVGYTNWCKRHGHEENEASWQLYFGRKQHPKCSAADIEIMGVSNDDLFAWIEANLEFDQLIREFAVKDKPMSGWVHVSWNAEGNNRNHAFDIG